MTETDLNQNLPSIRLAVVGGHAPDAHVGHFSVSHSDFDGAVLAEGAGGGRVPHPIRQAVASRESRRLATALANVAKVTGASAALRNA